MRKHNVLFACGHNAGRSRMAAALFNQLADQERVVATSALVAEKGWGRR